MFSVYHEHCYNMVAKTKETQSSNEIWDFRGLEQHRWDWPNYFFVKLTLL